ncbi:MAG TPA: DUF481 domain-containing protein [Blastocatellia bacterium]|nr:DUF481 domain-containing protein [Blastocatellia bacterium]
MKAHSGKARLLALSAFVLIGLSSSAAAKSVDDVCILNNGDRMTGEIKNLDHGQLKFKSAYMLDAVDLDWGRVSRLESKDSYIVLLTNGRVFTARIRLDAASAGDAFRIEEGTQSFAVKQSEVLRIRPANQNFWTQLNGSIDFGFSYTSGNSQYQTQLSASATYNREGYVVTGDVSTNLSGHKGDSATKRTAFDTRYKKLIKQKWYAGGLFDLLTSDQQSLDLRTTVGGLVGRNLFQTSRTSFNAFSGLAVSRERYSSVGQPRATNAESLVGLDFDTYRFRSLKIDTRFLVWPSLTDPGRVRMGLNSNFRIELIKDLFWNLNLYENFDSRPPATAKRNDLGITTSFGWTF